MSATVQHTLESYNSSDYGKELFLAPAKGAKTVTLLANALGVYPWHKYGGIVSDPSCLHVVTFDASALGGALRFLKVECGAPAEIGKVRVYNLQDECRAAFKSKTEYDGTFPNKVYDTIHKIQDETQKGNKVHAVIFSSLTMLAKAWLRSISGPSIVGQPMKKSTMDINKWDSFQRQMTEFQFQAQADSYHTLWEAHQSEKESKVHKDAAGNARVFDTIQVQGKTNEQFPAQCERPFVIIRKKGPWSPDKKANPKVNMVEFDTQPNLDFGESIYSGRNVSGILEPRENDLTEMFHKLDLKIGQWGA